MAISPQNLQTMLNITYRYTQKYRYVINPTKSQVLLFGKRSRLQPTITFKLGSENIAQTRQAKHLGIFLNDKLTDTDKVENATRKAKSSLFSLLSIKINSNYLNPITSASLVSKICIPQLLYGCELWSNLKQFEYDKLDKFQRLAAKKIQKFHMRTRTDMCLSMLGWKNIVYEIDYRKLVFLCNLCHLPNNVLTSHVFNARLSIYVCSVVKPQKGFIPDVIRILDKYNLSHVLINYIQTGEFPNKKVWKVKCRNSISNHETLKWSERLSKDNDFARFKFLHTNIEHAIIWECANDSKSLLNAHKISRLWINKPYYQNNSFLCSKCGIISSDAMKHCALECPATGDKILSFLHKISVIFGQSVTIELNSNDNETKFQKLIGRRISAITNRNVHKHFLRIAIQFIIETFHS
jgi:hypothetical protein